MSYICSYDRLTSRQVGELKQFFSCAFGFTAVDHDGGDRSVRIACRQAEHCNIKIVDIFQMPSSDDDAKPVDDNIARYIIPLEGRFGYKYFKVNGPHE